eukprot:COSAG02_NODE_18645_length_927_cov_1.297101_1_plen_67_part_01
MHARALSLLSSIMALKGAFHSNGRGRRPARGRGGGPGAARLLWYSQPYSDFRVPAARLSVILYVIVC